VAHPDSPALSPPPSPPDDFFFPSHLFFLLFLLLFPFLPFLRFPKPFPAQLFQLFHTPLNTVIVSNSSILFFFYFIRLVLFIFSQVRDTPTASIPASPPPQQHLKPPGSRVWHAVSAASSLPWIACPHMAFCHSRFPSRRPHHRVRLFATITSRCLAVGLSADEETR